MKELHKRQAGGSPSLALVLLYKLLIVRVADLRHTASRPVECDFHFHAGIIADGLGIAIKVAQVCIGADSVAEALISGSHGHSLPRWS